MAESLVAMAIMLGVYCFGLVASMLSARRWFVVRMFFSAFGGDVDGDDKVAVAVGIVAWPCVLMCIVFTAIILAAAFVACMLEEGFILRGRDGGSR